MKRKLIIITIFIFIFTSSLFAQEVPFTQEDRDRLIRLEATLGEFKDATDKRFEQVDKRFAELREDMNKRNTELREDMNKRDAALREDMNKRFEQMFNFLWILTGIFTTLTIGVIGFAYWDRRTIIRKAKEVTIEELERKGKLRDLINAFKELAKTDPKIETVLKEFHLL